MTTPEERQRLSEQWWNTDLGAPPKFTPTFTDYGIACDHDMPCAVLFQGKDLVTGESVRQSAVYNMNKGVFEPSWVAQRRGWKLVHADTKFKKWLIRTFFGD